MTDPVDEVRTKLSGRYEIEREIGQGAFATVYAARDLRHDRTVAVKILNADPSSDTSQLRFVREIKLLAQLQHPNILPLIDSGRSGVMLYYVMPYVSGESLGGRLRRIRQIPVEDALRITREIADAMAYAHSRSVIHRDIKPDNILLSGSHAVIADFGVARAIDVAGLPRITRTGVASPGTPAYMSPEQLMGERDLDARSDIYSLGCVLYEMLAGQPPFGGKEGFVKRFTEPPPLPSASTHSVPPTVDAVVAKALARAPHERYSSAEEMLRALQI